MKNRLHDKKAGIAILVIIFILSVVDVILRATIFSNIASTVSNYGEPLITAVFSIVLLIFAFKGKDRIFYILCGGWIGFFVFKQLIDLPTMVLTFFAAMQNSEGFTDFAILIDIVSMVCIIAIGGLFVEYLNDGTIYGKAFNILCLITLLTFVVNIIFAIYDIVVLKDISALLAILNNISRATFVFLFAFFAYDSAKKQLSKVDFSSES